MVAARFSLIRPFASLPCRPRTSLWIVVLVRSRQPSANQRVRNLHHEGTVSRRRALYSPSGGVVLDLLGCISAWVLQCEGTLSFCGTGARPLRRPHHRGALHPHHPRGGKRIASAFPLLRASGGELKRKAQLWPRHHGLPHPSTDGRPPLTPLPPVPLQGGGAGQALHWPITTALIHDPLSV
jgi:hypothetical protein